MPTAHTMRPAGLRPASSKVSSQRFLLASKRFSSRLKKPLSMKLTSSAMKITTNTSAIQPKPGGKTSSDAIELSIQSFKRRPPQN